MHPELTGMENIFLNGTILGMKKEEIKTKLDEITFQVLKSFANSRKTIFVRYESETWICHSSTFRTRYLNC